MQFTDLTSKAVIYVVILASETENPTVELGVDFRQEICRNIEDKDLLEKNWKRKSFCQRTRVYFLWQESQLSYLVEH